MKVKKTLMCVSILSLLVGLGGIVGGFFYDVIFAGIPYQDPSAEMQQRYDFHAKMASYIAITGAAILSVGCLLLLASLFYKRKYEQGIDETCLPERNDFSDAGTKTTRVITFLLSHLVAVVISFIVFVAVPVLFTVAIMIIDNDGGGPLFFPIFVIMCLFFSGCACISLFAICGLLQLIHLKLPFQWWVPVVLFFPLSFAILLLSCSELLWFVAFMSLLGTLAFSVYWLSLLGSAKIMNWAKSKI